MTPDPKIDAERPVTGPLVDRALALGASVRPWDSEWDDEGEDGQEDPSGASTQTTTTPPSALSAREQLVEQAKRLPDAEVTANLLGLSQVLGESMPAWSPEAPREERERALVDAALLWHARERDAEAAARSTPPAPAPTEEATTGGASPDEGGAPPPETTSAEASPPATSTEPRPAPAVQARALMVGRNIDDLDRKAIRVLVKQYGLEEHVPAKGSADDIRTALRALAAGA